MMKRKIRINLMDILILLVLAAAVIVLLYVFVWNDSTDSVQVQNATITYVVEVVQVDERYSDLIENGQPVVDAVTRQPLGTINGTPESRATLIANFDSSTQKEVYTEMPGKVNLYITITAEANVTDRGYTVSGVPIRVGERLSLMLPNMQCTGFCIQLEE